jgi:hypothetical protein
MFVVLVYQCNVNISLKNVSFFVLRGSPLIGQGEKEINLEFTVEPLNYMIEAIPSILILRLHLIIRCNVYILFCL